LLWHSNAIATTFSLYHPNTVANEPPQCCNCHRLILLAIYYFWQEGSTFLPQKQLLQCHHCTMTVCIQTCPPQVSVTPLPYQSNAIAICFPCTAMTLCRQPHHCCCLFHQPIVNLWKQGITRGFLQDSAAATPLVVCYAVRRLNYSKQKEFSFSA